MVVAGVTNNSAISATNNSAKTVTNNSETYTYKRLTIATRSKVIAIGCMVICAIQLPDVLFRRLPATLSNPNIAREQALRAKAFEEKVEKIRKSQVLPKPAP